MRTLLTRRETLGGLSLIALGSFALWQSSHYAMGDLHRMGSGYVPTVMSVLILACGVILFVRSLFEEGEAVERPGLRAMAAAAGGVAIFALTLESLGLIIATVALVLAVNFSGRSLPWSRLIALCVVLFAIVYCLFVLGLGMPIPLMPD